jgi:hypothetical protein
MSRYVLIAISIASFWLVVLVLLLDHASDKVLVAAVLATCGTTSLGALAVCSAVEEVSPNIRIALNDVAALSAKSRR